MDAPLATTTSTSQVDYGADQVWERLSALFAQVEPRPASRRGRVRCEPGWHWRTDLTDFDLWLAVSGRGQFTLHGEVHPIAPGTLFLLRPGDDGVARQQTDDPLTVVYVHFDFVQAGSGRAAAVASDLLPARHIPLRDPSRLDRLLTRVVRLQQMPTVLGGVEARLLLHQAILEAYRHDAANQGVTRLQPDPRIAAVLAHLHGHPGHRLSLRQASTMVCLSPDRFSRLFTAQTGHPFRRYALEVRLDRARQLLEETGMTVAAVATALGYGDAFLFSRQFKARYGTAPSHLRRPRPGRAAAAGDDGPLSR